jgi:L-malate glycosyltransferase
MKILFYNHTGQVSGAERLLLMVLSRLDRDAVQPVAVCPQSGELAERLSELRISAEAIALLEARFTWRLDRLFRYLKSAYDVTAELRQMVKHARPDLVHANSIRAGLVATIATTGLGMPVIWHLHDELPSHPLSTFIRLFALMSSRSRFLAVSNAVSKNFRGALAPLQKRLKVILNAIDATRFTPDARERTFKRVELGIENAECAVGIVGQVTPRKGQLELLRAFANVLKELPKAVLVIAGAPLFNRDQDYADLVKESARKLGIANSVRMLGARRDVAAIMQSLDLLVVNSVVEPFGLVAVEAMASGTPVIATNTGGLPEIIEHERTGWLIPARDERALAAAIITLTNRPGLRLRLAARAKQSLAPRFTCERYMIELNDYYQSLISLEACAALLEPASRPNEETRLASAR